MESDSFKEKILASRSLEEAVENIFDGKNTGGERACVLGKESIDGEVARQYDILGKESRKNSYQKICYDFKNSTGCYAANHPNMKTGTIVDVGCGSGLLALELMDNTNGNIVGIDPSQDMIDLANKNLEEYAVGRIEDIKKFQERIPKFIERKDVSREDLEMNIEFRKGDVYNLSSLVPEEDVNYIVCRNVLHRCKNPKEAIENMYSILAPSGKIYLRDLRRDADWEIVKDRIGAKRWEHPSLVRDYVGAMASMLNRDELGGILDELNVDKYDIREGYYKVSGGDGGEADLNEYENDVEYVCIIEKS